MILVRDIETRSTVDVGDVGISRYATHPTTEVLCVGYCVDESGPVKIWKPGDRVPREFQQAEYAAAHNAAFEMAIERAILGPRYGFPIIPVERNICTMAIAHALALPAALGNLAKALNLEHQKDVVGGRLMLQLSKPRRAKKDEDPNAIHWFEDTDRLNRLYLYCKEDVETAREALYLLPWLSEDEYQVWLLDQKINERGLYIDAELCKAARKIIEAAGPYIDAQISALTAGQVTTINQVAKLTEWLRQYLPDLPDINKETIKELLNNGVEGPARQALELRASGASAASKKINPLLEHCDRDGRLRGAFVYHAAGTGRWSSRGAQLHNLKRLDTKDVEQAIEVIRRGNFNYARSKYTNPLGMIGGVIRAMVRAAPGNILLGADFSGIEARVTAWIAGEKSKLKVFRGFDAGIGPDPYVVAAAKIYGIDADDLYARYKAGEPLAREQRQIGKACELAFGYQGGVGAFRRFTPSGTTNPKTQADIQHGHAHGRTTHFNTDEDRIASDNFSDQEIERIKNAWRSAHPNITRFWSLLNSAAWRAVRNPGDRFLLDNLAFQFDNGFLWLELPSGRKLAYPAARIINGFVKSGVIIETKSPWSDRLLVFKDNSSGRWYDMQFYGGLLCENVVQAIARDLLAVAMVNLDIAGLNIVAHVHDEVVIEVPKAKAAAIEPLFKKIMSANPPWAEGLPIAVNIWVNERYTK